MITNKWIIPFKGRNSSGAWDLNFLYQNGRTYIMDNHRAALWCWLQQISLKEKYNLIHIDRHYDLATGRYFELWKDVLPYDLQKLTIDEYLDISCKIPLGVQRQPVIKWDNYLSIFLDRYPDIIETCIFATHDEDEELFCEKKILYFPWQLPNNIAFGLQQGQWIVNIDLDYFFYSMENDQFHTEEKYMFSEIYIKELFSAISRKYNDGLISVLTISLSPECSGGWESAERLCNKICGFLGIPFSLNAR